MPAAEPTTGRALVDGLLAHGVDTVFGMPGVQTYALFDALAGAPTVSVIVPGTSRPAPTWPSATPRRPGAPGSTRWCPAPACSTLGRTADRPRRGPAGALLTSEIPTAVPRPRARAPARDARPARPPCGTSRSGRRTCSARGDAPGLLADAFQHAPAGVRGRSRWPCPGTCSADPRRSSRSRRACRRAADRRPERRSAEAVDAARRRPQPDDHGRRRGAGRSSAVRALAEPPAGAGGPSAAGAAWCPTTTRSGFPGASGFERWADTDVVLALGTRMELAWFRWPDRPPGCSTINVDLDPQQRPAATQRGARRRRRRGGRGAAGGPAAARHRPPPGRPSSPR